MTLIDVQFYTSLRTMLDLSAHQLLTDTFPPSLPHNVGARLLRHGLAVSAFSLLEKYLEQKFTQLASSIAKSPIPYASLPDPLRKFLTVDATSGLSNKLNFLDDSEKQAFAETHIALIASFAQVPAQYTSLGFSPRGSNVGHEDIKKAIIACGVTEPWNKLSSIATSIGVNRISLSVDFKGLAKIRHSSAHNPDGNVPTADLKTHIETAILIGISVALLLSAMEQAYATSRNPQQLRVALAAVSASCRFIDEQPDGTWLERSTSVGRGIKSYADEKSAAQGAAARAKTMRIVCRDVQRVPVALL